MMRTSVRVWPAGTALRTPRGRFATAGIVSPIVWHDVTFVFSDHLGMTQDPTFTDNIRYRLLESPH